MQIVINIDENVFTRLFDNGTEDYEIVNDDLFVIAKSIRKGTPLPKGHGKLIDVSELLTTTDIRADGSEFTYVPYSAIVNAQTILEADEEKADTENKEERK